MKKFQHTPLSAAKALRIGFEKNVAKTQADYFKQQQREGFWLTTWNLSQLIYEQCGVKMGGATIEFSEQVKQAMIDVFPELWAEYWEEVFKKE